MDTELDVFSEGFIELGEVVLVLSNLANQIETLLDKVLTNNFEDLVLLQRFTRDIEGKILRVDYTLHEVKVLWNEVFTVIHDEHPLDIELDVVTLLLGLEKVERSPADLKLNGAQGRRTHTNLLGMKSIALNSS
jgi:hypothetical protein